VAVEHDVAARLDHVVLEAGGERERGICAARMTPHHTYVNPAYLIVERRNTLLAGNRRMALKNG
jgi:hypothetical protein